MTAMARGTRHDIAIVGMACRLPGGTRTPADFWRLLTDETDAVGSIPAERWSQDLLGNPRPGEPGKSYTWSAGVIEDWDRFDPAAFGISPREAAQMDPQQRLLLELSVEALEDAGRPRSEVAGSETGVFVGVSSTDFISLRWSDPASANAYTGTGNALSIIANRVSYCLDLHGPSLVVDTACSSSLVALHLAAQALREEEAELAIVGGVNTLISPFTFITFSQASMLSPAGRCKAFSDDAHGYVRSEGGVVFLLAPLKRAIANGDPIHAVIRASGVNQDGRTTGLSMPNEAAQASLLKRVYEGAKLSPDDVVYVEAHGTGTAVGDPIEAAALGAVLGQPRTTAQPLPIGSAKSNVGHLEPASGLVGVLKSVLSLNHGVVPTSLHCSTPNPGIDFTGLNLKVLDAPLTLPKPNGAALIGVNSFGFGGTNAHAVLSRYDHSVLDRRVSKPRMAPLLLSAHSAETLQALARQYADLFAAEPEVNSYDVCYARAIKRDHGDHRLAVTAGDRSAVVSGLGAFAAGEQSDGVVSGRSGGRLGRLALVYSGNGAQWHGMARELLAESALARRVVARVDRIFEPLTGWSIAAEFANDDAERFAATDVAQPLLFALQLAATAVLRQAGVCVEATVGHSVGEIAAAHVAGCLSLTDAVRIIVDRSRAQNLTRGAGLMAVVGGSEALVADLLEDTGIDLEIAGLNSPSSTVVSGLAAEIVRLREVCGDRGLYVRVLDLDYAFHSRSMDPVRSLVLDHLSDVAPRPHRLLFASTVSGGLLKGDALNADYWWQNIREPVRFCSAIAALANAGIDTFLEVGPQPILQAAMRETVRETHPTATVMHSLTKGDGRATRLSAAALATYTVGCPLAWTKVFPEPGGRVDLPPFPWHRDRHWPSPSTESNDAVARRRVHPLLGYAVPHMTNTWENDLDADVQTAYADHRVSGRILFPAAGFAALAAAAAQASFRTDEPTPADDGAATRSRAGIDIFELDIREPLVLPSDAARVVQVQIVDDRVLIRSRDRLSGPPWTLHAEARISERSWPLADAPLTARENASSGNPLQPRHARVDVSGEALYALAEDLGLQYGSAFRRVARVRIDGNFARAEFTDTPEAANNADPLDPFALDAAFQALIAILTQSSGEDEDRPPLYLPVQMDRVRIGRAPGQAAFATARLEATASRSVVADVELITAAGDILVRAESCRFIRAEAAGARRTQVRTRHVSVPAERPRRDDLNEVLDPRELASAARAGVAATRVSLRHSDPAQEAPVLLEGLATAYALRAIASSQAASRTTRRDPVTLDPLVAGPMLTGLQDAMVADGLLLPDGSPHIDAHLEPGEIWRTLVAEHPNWSAEAVLACRAGENLANARTGAALSAVMDADDTQAMVDQLTRSGPSHAVLNGALVAMANAIAERWPGRRPLRILEIGSGFGRIDRRFMTAFADIPCDYLYTDVTDEGIARARAELGDLAFVRFAVFDLAADGDADGLAGEHFDLIVSATMAHVSPNLASSLRRLRSHLHCQGALVLAHRRADRFTDLILGARPYWWQADDRGRIPAALMRSTREWKVLLGDAGFQAPPTVVGDEPEAEPEGSDAVLAIAVNPSVIGNGTSADPPRVRVILADPGGVADAVAAALVERLRAAGVATQRSSRARLAPDLSLRSDSADTADLELIDLTALDRPKVASDDLLSPATDHCLGVLGLVAALFEMRSKRDTIDDQDGTSPSAPIIRVVTTGAMVLDRGPTNGAAIPSPKAQPEQAAMWGLVRVLMNETPDLQWSLVDVQTEPTDQDALSNLVERLADETLLADGEQEVLLTAQGRRALRVRDRGVIGTNKHQSHDDATSYALPVPKSGALDGLAWTDVEHRPPGPGEVKINVRAVGLNFRDVMLAMGLLPDAVVEDGFVGATLGMECAGDVVAIGSGVEGVAVGDAVVGMAPRSFSALVTAPSHTVRQMPSDLAYTAAVTMPVAFFTAAYALEHLADLKEGETVLIHGGAGGVGLAALQIAHARGARVIATAGSDSKRTVLRLLGVDHVLDSRSLAFADRVRHLTGGKGVDVVLNCLAGEGAVRSLELLTPFGRFVELGKRDFVANTRIGLRPLRRNISYFAVDADALLVQKPGLSTSLFESVIARIHDGRLRPLLHRVFRADEIVEAFRLMQHSSHIGKIVIDVSKPPSRRRVAHKTAPKLALATGATYLIAGGLGGLGLKTAAWLAERGAKNLVLTSRSGVPTEEGVAAIADLTARGVAIQCRACDVADAGAVAALVSSLPYERPLRGIVHAAMVLDDRTADRIDNDSLRRVLAPKVQGAWNLHRATAALPLDLFICFSSATTVFGNPGQAAYVAANLALEQLARWRHDQGLPALAVCWGPIGDAGYLAANTTVRDHLSKRLGRRPLSVAEALGTLDDLLAGGEPVVSVMDLDWGAVKRDLPIMATRAFDDVLRAVDDTAEPSVGHDLCERLAGMTAHEALPVVRSAIAELAAVILRLPVDRLDTSRSLMELGMDSLMGLELSMAVERALGIGLPDFSLGERTSVDTLAAKIADRLAGAIEPETAEAKGRDVVATLMRQHVDEHDDPADLAAISDLGNSPDRFENRPG